MHPGAVIWQREWLAEALRPLETRPGQIQKTGEILGVGCTKCGDTETELHTNGRCGNCGIAV